MQKESKDVLVEAVDSVSGSSLAIVLHRRCRRPLLTPTSLVMPRTTLVQLDHIGSTSQDKCGAQHLETLLVLDLQRPASAAAALTFDAASGTGSTTAGASALPLGEPVQHVAIGGGPHLLLAAATRDTLVVASLEGLAAHLFQRQASGGGAAGPPQPLWQQLAAAHCGHADVLAIRWGADWAVLAFAGEE